MSEWVGMGAPILAQPYGQDGPVTERRLCSLEDVAEQGMATTVAEHALVEMGRQDLADYVYANKVGAPSYPPGIHTLSPPDRMLVTNAFLIGHIRAGHTAWMDFDSFARLSIVCIDCERKSEDLSRARARP